MYENEILICIINTRNNHNKLCKKNIDNESLNLSSH